MRSVARSSAGAVVAGLTAAALAAVGFLAFQAQAAPDRPARATSSASPGKTGEKAKDGKDAAGKGKTGQEKAAAPVPAGSGTGQRVVYALGQKRVWLVGADGKATRTFEVTPSTAALKPGTYVVTSRAPQVVGSDGTPVEHVVRFHSLPGIVFGFSAAVDGSMPAPAANAKKTGGIRETRPDGDAMWAFAVRGTKVVVVQ